MATYYVSSLATGGGDGSEGDPWTLAESMAGAAAGDVVWIKADGTYAVASKLTPAAGAVFAGYGAIIGDGTRPTLQASGATGQIFDSNQSGASVVDLIFDGDSTPDIEGALLWGNSQVALRCEFINCPRAGLRITSSSGRAESCRAESCGSGFEIAAGGWLHCVARNNDDGFGNAGGSTAVLTGCVAADNSGLGFKRGGYAASGCVATSNGSHGFEGWSGISLWADCLSYGNGGWGWFVPSATTRHRMLRCAGGGNTSGNYSPVGIPFAEDFITLAADPFVDALNGDFNLNDAAGGGALLRAASFALPGLASTAAYPFRPWVSDDFGGGGGGLTGVSRARVVAGA